LLTYSFPFVRDWLNLHALKDDPEARLICNLCDGTPVGPEAMWGMMKRLRQRIERMLRQGSITDPQERDKLEYLLRTKKWNPYCIRHSAITFDSDLLPDYALNRKVRWSMNSKQASRYIKRRMGDAVKKQILKRDGILLEDKSMQRVAILRHYINIIWHYGWHSLQSQIADYITNLMYTIKNMHFGNACGQPVPMPILSLAVPGQMPKCSGWCQFRYYCVKLRFAFPYLLGILTRPYIYRLAITT
jgi:hypothetical protein